MLASQSRTHGRNCTPRLSTGRHTVAIDPACHTACHVRQIAYLRCHTVSCMCVSVTFSQVLPHKTVSHSVYLHRRCILRQLLGIFCAADTKCKVTECLDQHGVIAGPIWLAWRIVHGELCIHTKQGHAINDVTYWVCSMHQLVVQHISITGQLQETHVTCTYTCWHLAHTRYSVWLNTATLCVMHACRACMTYNSSSALLQRWL